MQLMQATLLFFSCYVASTNADLDPLDGISEAEFEAIFHERPAADPAVEAARAEALLANEAIVHEVNEAFQAGEKTWYDAINKMANVPADELVAEKTGLLMPPKKKYSRGLLMPPLDQRYHEESERYFDRYRYSRQEVPDSYSSVAEGYVTPVKNQMQCGSCTAFASVATLEVCLAKVKAIQSDYAEQEFIDCAYDNKNALGCNGAYIQAYFNWANQSLTKPNLASELEYPYLNTKPRLSCPPETPLPSYNRGARMVGTWFTYDGDEELMKKLVYTHGAVVTAYNAKDDSFAYAGGVYAGCAPEENENNHAVAVVGYGTADIDGTSVDYWLVKNSWSDTWGEGGYLRIKRGVHMCGIGRAMSVVDCAPLADDNQPLPPPAPTTEEPTNDTEAPTDATVDYAKYNATQEYAASTVEPSNDTVDLPDDIDEIFNDTQEYAYNYSENSEDCN